MLRPSDAAAVAAAFGWAGPARLEGPVDRGEMGQVWRLVISSHVYAIKETFADLDDAGIARSHAFAERAATVGVIAPHQHRTADGRLATRTFGAPVRCYDWINLAPPDRHLDAGEVGRTLAALHRAGGPADGPVDPWFTAPVGSSRWDELIMATPGAPFAAAMTSLRDDLIAAESIMVDPVDDLLHGHRDLFADNVRHGDHGLVVIDWDNAGPVRPADELAFVLAEYGTSPARAAELITAYRRAGGPARLTGQADFTMIIAVLHHLLAADVDRWRLGHDRDRFARRVAEFTDDPLGTEQIRRLLEVVRAA